MKLEQITNNNNDQIDPCDKVLLKKSKIGSGLYQKEMGFGSEISLQTP
jgi:hypothetical protein